ncbi:MAG: polyprenyl synthetase family protein [Proteobacteria bacterium]|nr:polyprenyl synthetase family protein [Pseudomonadota bacterium]MCL2306666.1 polyprenyl synthetase family protein [Pseudomonadota bacterium]
MTTQRVTIEPSDAASSAAAMITWQATHRARVETALARFLTAPSSSAEAPRLWEAMRYATLSGGKRWRALLVYATAELCGADVAVADAPAAAVELLHAYSLVHDDLPCMDDDAVRRGQPACHIAFGEAMALLAGDALQAQAFEVLAQSRMPDPAAACALLAKAAGASGMVGGQARDLSGEATTMEALEAMHRKKTGALIEAAVMLGAACGASVGHATQTALTRYAAAIGLAFQVADDVLDVEGSTPDLGKTAGKDAAQNKATYVALLGLPSAKEKMRALCEEAQQALELFGTAAWPLKALAAQAVARSY